MTKHNCFCIWLLQFCLWPNTTAFAFGFCSFASTAFAFDFCSFAYDQTKLLLHLTFAVLLMTKHNCFCIWLLHLAFAVCFAYDQTQLLLHLTFAVLLMTKHNCFCIWLLQFCLWPNTTAFAFGFCIWLLHLAFAVLLMTKHNCFCIWLLQFAFGFCLWPNKTAFAKRVGAAIMWTQSQWHNLDCYGTETSMQRKKKTICKIKKIHKIEIQTSLVTVSFAKSKYNPTKSAKSYQKCQSSQEC